MEKQDELKEVKECICGGNNYHTPVCRRHKRRILVNRWRRARNKKLREEHRCIYCGKKVKPIITYPQYCNYHRIKARESYARNKKNNEKKSTKGR